MKPKLIQQGAEAKIFLSNDFVVKDRIKKSYRIPELDKKIRKQRTKSETKLLHKASKIINAPIPENSTEKNKIIMPFIKGKKLSEHLDNFSLKKQKQICRQVGEDVTKLHNADIIHGDLTTSNMILVERNTDNFRKQLIELKKLNLPEKDYAIFGSGPLAIHGIRDSQDIDLFVKKDLWEELKKKHKEKIHNIKGREVRMIKIGEIEVYKNWFPEVKNINKVIEDSEIIEGFPFVKLNYVVEWKKKYGREKDKKDIKLIKKYFVNQKNLFKSGTKQLIREQNKPIIYFIDFGLGFISHKFEDKAVDIHLLKQALEAKHFKHWEVLFNEFEKAYKKYKDSKIVFERLKAVERRGRYKG